MGRNDSGRASFENLMCLIISVNVTFLKWSLLSKKFCGVTDLVAAPTLTFADQCGRDSIIRLIGVINSTEN
jgi:hypothetical protein